MTDKTTKAPVFFLAGDSTTANQSIDGGGWGTGFLLRLKLPAWGINYGCNGATTISFIEQGIWTKVLASVEDNKADYECFVTIQVSRTLSKTAD